ncbi:NAD(P)/FAD-dependent oxidoreductase [Conexibacter sp. SYSU D00693]|uniref:NAD(P)/FAD-dependent oxidoreductase n=1 Tax=Conexibacter sp. SYSU D00693 TaxID=2812560 RepID=UPI00196A4D33|nr:NAD(P)/FAD-dependent oxidoreductase [Conexibacter sp. SYSU D00693]
MSAVEQADVVVVGGRIAGSAVAITLARGGRKVVVLERRSFPSDTLSTHVLVPYAVAEAARLGALERLLATGAQRSPYVHVGAGNVQLTEHWPTAEGIGYGLCIPRPEQDHAFMETARAAGADVRERADVTEVVWRDGRAAGVRYVDADGAEHELHARLVVGADGRRSTIAAEVGSWRPYRGSRNGRGAAFRYMDDPRAGDRRWGETMSQWRWGRNIGYTFPVFPGRVICLLMPPAEEIGAMRRDPDGAWDALLASDPDGIGWRLEGATNRTKLRSTAETTSFFRASSGPGWALAGDAGHFKDPVIGSGQRDALRFGRRLGELVAPVLDEGGSDAELDAALRTWERERDRQCNASYHWGCRESAPTEPATPLLQEVIRTFEGNPAHLSHNFNRTLEPERAAGPRALALGLLNALHRHPGRRGEILREALDELPAELGIRADRWFGVFRASSSRPTERPDFDWPPPPAPSARRAAPEPGVDPEEALARAHEVVMGV